MKHRFSHYANVVLSFFAVISTSIVSPASANLKNSADVPAPAGAIATLNPVKPDFMLDALSDGTIQFKDGGSNKVLWSLPTGPSLYSSYRDGKSKFDYVDCGDNGELYWNSKEGIMQELSVTMEQFISHTPYILENGGVTLGAKTTTVFLVDAKSGRLVHTYGVSSPSSIVQSGNDKGFPIDSKFGQLVEPRYMEREDVELPFYVTRTDYSLDTYAPNSTKVLSKTTLAHIGAAFLCPRLEPDTHLDMQLPCNLDVHVYHSYKPSISLEQSDGLVEATSQRSPLQLPGGKPDVWNQAITSKPDNDNDADSVGGNRSLLTSDTEQKLPSQPKHANQSDYQPNDSILHKFVMHYWRYFVALGMLPKVFVSVCAVSLVLAVILRLVVGRFAQSSREEVELDNQSNNSNPKTMSSKKKKNRKSGKNGSAEKKDRLLSSKNDNGSAQGHNETVPFLNLNRLDGSAEGRRIGKLCVSSVEIAKGSNGTVVFEGMFDGRRVAVKRLVLTHHDAAFKEIQNLIASDRHPNIVRWYGVEYDQDFVYLSLERCTCSLDDLIQICLDLSQDEVLIEQQALKSVIEYKGRLDSVKVVVRDVNLWKTNGYPSPLLLQLMRDVVSGIVHLHELGIIHRDLKPQNVLIIKDKLLSAKVSDMGISRRLHENMSSLGHLATGCGSSGWQAPEQLLQGRQTRAVDLFSLGCVLFFCITGGRHPFGDRLERDINIVKNNVDLFLVESIPEAMDLFSHLLNPDPELRPKAEEVLCHPLFWSCEKRLSFLRDTSDRVELEDREASSDILSALESVAPMALGGKWDEKMEPAFINNIGRYRRYKYDSVRDLLRVIRNKLNHYRELPREIQELLGLIPEGFNDYFTSRFPKLVMEVYKVMQKYCREDECFLKYFEADERS